ncbi:MAG: DUF72 domain-containing protein [Chloroflexia bacterium]
MIRIGTSGYSYADWVGRFYPEGIPERDMLSYYAREFDTTEINFTYYRLPDPYTMGAIARKVPEGFLFTVKASQVLTHAREDNREAFRQFAQALKPLQEAGKFGCVLAQFPWSFRPSPENHAYLEYLRERFGDLPVVVEFRNAAWMRAETFSLLRRLDLGFCCVDEPRLKGLLPPVAEATASVAYVRFHGRNAAKWWQHEHAWERYDYSYTEEELREWVPKIRKLAQSAETVFVFANNHWQGQAVTTARQLRMLLADEAGSA